MAYLALFAALTGSAYAAAKIGSAQVADNSLRGLDIRDRSIAGADIARRTLQAKHFRPGVLKAGPQGPAGPKGEPGVAGARGPSFGDGRQVPNVKDIACNTPVVVGTLPLTVPQPSRIWTQAQGAIEREGSGATDFALWLRLRNAGGTTTVATTTPAWDAGAPPDDDFIPLAPGGILLAGESTESPSPPFVAPAGSYILQLIALAQGPCAAATLPSFGLNQGAQMGYVLTGTG